MFPNLETERLILREITKEDTPAIFSLFSNDEITRYYGQESIKDMEQAKAFVNFFKKNYLEKRGIRWGIQIKGTKKIIGTIAFNALSLKHKRAEIGYEIHPNEWRKGYTSEALAKILSYGFDVLNLNRIGAVVFIENIPSNQLLLKMGFQKEGILKRYIYQNNKANDVYMYSMLK